MYTLDSDILAILLALISFVIPAITAIREKKKKQGQQQEAENESPDELLHRQDVEELFSELLGLQDMVDQEQEESIAAEETVLDVALQVSADDTRACASSGGNKCNCSKHAAGERPCPRG